MDNNNQNNIYKNSQNPYGEKFNPEVIKKAAKSGNPSELINSLSEKDKQKLNSILNDKKALEEVLKSPQAAALFKLFSGGERNG